MAEKMRHDQEIVIRYTRNGAALTYFIRPVANVTMPIQASANEQTVVATLTTAIAAVLDTPPV